MNYRNCLFPQNSPNLMQNRNESGIDLIMPQQDHIPQQAIPLISKYHFVSQFAYIAFFAFLGVYVRILITIEGTIIPGIVYPQILGCFILGLGNTNSWISSIPSLKSGLSIGLCGCLTSFSGVILESYLNLTGKTWDGFALLFITFAASFAAFNMGKHAGKSTPRSGAKLELKKFIENENISLTLAGLAFLAISVWLSITKDKSRPFALFLGPIGAMLRMLLSRFNNRTSIPLGTFLANSIGSGILFLLVLSRNLGVSSLSCEYFFGAEVGFCGSLTTISTFVSELDEMNIREMYIYLFASLLVGIILGILILGWLTFSGHTIEQCIMTGIY